MRYLKKFTVALLAVLLTMSFAAADEFSDLYGGAEKDDPELDLMRMEIPERFNLFAFEDEESGRTMMYNLYVPESYDGTEAYPLLLFMADASTVGKDPRGPLYQGWGAMIFATDESQAKHPCIVLAPAYSGPETAVNDDYETGVEVEVTLRLLDYILETYNIDRDRIYTTGQSMGCMMSMYYQGTYPDLFAASLIAGGHWDHSVFPALESQKMLFVCSAGDKMASAYAEALIERLDADGVPYGRTGYSAKEEMSVQNARISEMTAEGNDLNFVFLDPKTVMDHPDDPWLGGEHMYSFDWAFKAEEARDWLFRQSR